MAARRSDPDGLGFVPPHSLEAEMSALGSMMLSQGACEQVLSRIDEGDFYSPAHQEICRAIQELNRQSQAVDLVTVKNMLVARDRLAAAGGVEYLIQLAESVPSASNASHYAMIVQDYAVLRRLEGAGRDVVSLVHDPELDVQTKVENAENMIYDVGRRRLGQEFKTVRSLAKDFFTDVDKIIDSGIPILGLQAGLPDLDSITTGHYPGDLIILAARPAMGKTSLALNIAANVAKDSGGSVAVFSLEMTGPQLVRRMISTMARVPMSAFRKGNISDRDYQRLADAVDELYRLPVFIDDTSDISPLQVKGKCRRLQSQGPLSLIVVDYLQLMRSNKRTENRAQEIGDIARALKQLAKDLMVPVMALCQVNRAVESRDDKRPNLSDLRESGSIEAEADLVMTIFRKEYYERKTAGSEAPWNPESAEVAELGLLKHRSGPTGTVLLAFQPAYTRFSPLDESSKAEYLASLKHGPGE